MTGAEMMVFLKKSVVPVEGGLVMVRVGAMPSNVMPWVFEALMLPKPAMAVAIQGSWAELTVPPALRMRSVGVLWGTRPLSQLPASDQFLVTPLPIHV